ncbi:MAG: hypothetical protein ACRD0K_20670, partial [Egibacteraceae bacterium]
MTEPKKVTLWGASQSGKTSYLGALGLAALRQDGSEGYWRVTGADEATNDWLIARTLELSERRFPSPNSITDDCRFLFTQDTMSDSSQEFDWQDGEQRVAFEFRVLDHPGWLLNKREERSKEWWEILDHILECDGLAYLYDPQPKGQPLEQRPPLWHLAQRAQETGKADSGGRLPHRLAVCVTKFDHPETFKKALDDRWITQDTSPSRHPLPTDTRQYFEHVADSHVQEAIKSHF